MVNRIFPSRSGLPKSTPTTDDAVSAPPAAQPAAPTAGAARSVGSRVLGGLGFLPRTKATVDAPTRFAFPAGSLMPSRASETSVKASQPTSRQVADNAQDKLLENTIRAALPGLAGAEASRFQRLLDNTLRAGDPARQTLLLQMLEANVRTAVAQQGAASPQATVWHSLAKTSVNVHFQGSVASMSKAKEAQLLRLQHDIQQLPPELATGYQTLLRDILASKGAAKRDALLNRMAKQVAARGSLES